MNTLSLYSRNREMMNRINHWSYRVVTLFMVIAISTSSYAELRNSEIIWQEKEQFIALVDSESARGSGATDNNHPQTLSEKMISEMLAGIGIAKKDSRFSVGGRKTEIGNPLFSYDEIENLARYLKAAFSQAHSSQDIVFRSHGKKEGLGSVIKIKTINTGRMFWKDDRLNIIFGEIHGKNKSKVIYDRVQKDSSKREYGSRFKPSKKVDEVFVQVVGIDSHEASEGAREDWIEIDYRILSQSNHDQTGHSHEQSPSMQTHRQVNKDDSSHSSLDDSEKNRSQNRQYEMMQGNKHNQKQMEMKLKELKHFYDKGLISEKLYEEKVKEIIDQRY